ncbi:MAG: amino acid--[acyl-carrier-protein] ligase, partial [Acidimicrobiales bacterium]
MPVTDASSPEPSGQADGAEGDLHRQQRERLVASGLLVPMGVDGLYGRSGAFEDVVSAVERLLSLAGGGNAVPTLRFPPVLAKVAFEKTGYLRSFPSLTASLQTFAGDDRDHRRLLSRFEAGEDWTSDLVPAETVLCPAACHPLYGTIVGPVPPGGMTWNVYGYVFRHEPSVDPARMQAFRQYEYVFVGDAGGARAHRDEWLTRAVELLAGLGLDVRAEVSSDAFFGRTGHLLAANQKTEKLKYEVLAETSGSPTLTAIASANCHEDHFGSAFDILTTTGEVAH